MQQQSMPPDKLTITILGNSYTTEVSVGKTVDFAKNKALYSQGMYNSITDGIALDIIDIISALHAFFPEIKKDLKVQDFGDLKPNEFSQVIDVMNDEFFPWYSEWAKRFQNAKKAEKKQDKKDD